MPFASRLRSIVKDVPQMAATTATVNFGSDAEELAVRLGAYCIWQAVKEAGPTCAGVKFLLAGKQWQRAPSADIGARAFFSIECTCERALCGLFTQDDKFTLSQALFPLLGREVYPLCICYIIWRHVGFLFHSTGACNLATGS